jgi:hypothetical protein
MGTRCRQEGSSRLPWPVEKEPGDLYYAYFLCLSFDFGVQLLEELSCK